MRTNSCQSDSSGFQEEPFIPALSQQNNPGPELMKVRHVSARSFFTYCYIRWCHRVVFICHYVALHEGQQANIFILNFKSQFKTHFFRLAFNWFIVFYVYFILLCILSLCVLNLCNFNCVFCTALWDVHLKIVIIIYYSIQKLHEHMNLWNYCSYCIFSFMYTVCIYTLVNNTLVNEYYNHSLVLFFFYTPYF